MRLKEMEDLATSSAREVKIAAAEERERDKYSSVEGHLIYPMAIAVGALQMTYKRVLSISLCLLHV